VMVALLQFVELPRYSGLGHEEHPFVVPASGVPAPRDGLWIGHRYGRLRCSTGL
jgi:hypothetical protein